MAMRVGVLLSGCGYLDGSEIHEAVSILIALDRRGATVICMAPDIAQTEVTNHRNGKISRQGRNVLEESARIARGAVVDLAEVSVDSLDALILPGGFGAAKNLSNFSSKGPAADVNPQVAALLMAMHEAHKPIGLACVASVLAARVFGQAEFKPRLTIGTEAETAHAINEMHAEHINTGAMDLCIDEANRLVSTPCYMNDVGLWTVYQGAERMVEEVLRLAGDVTAGVRSHRAASNHIAM